jgi:hypothetical protein
LRKKSLEPVQPVLISSHLRGPGIIRIGPQTMNSDYTIALIGKVLNRPESAALLNFWIRSFVKDIKTILKTRRFFFRELFLPTEHLRNRPENGSNKGQK